MPLLMNKRSQKLEEAALFFTVIFGTRKIKALCPWLFGNPSQEGKILWKKQKSVSLTAGFQEWIQGLCHYEMPCQREEIASHL